MYRKIVYPRYTCSIRCIVILWEKIRNRDILAKVSIVPIEDRIFSHLQCEQTSSLVMYDINQWIHLVKLTNIRYVKRVNG